MARMSTLREQLLAEIDSYCATAGMKETTFGRLAVNDGKFVGRLRGGKDITVGTLERIRDFIAPARTSPPASNDATPRSVAAGE